MSRHGSTIDSLRLMTGAIIMGIAFSGSCVTMAAEKTDEIIKEDTIPLIQEGDIIIPEEDYTYHEDYISSYFDQAEQTADSTRQKQAQEIRENNDSTLDERQKACAKKLYDAMINLEDTVSVTEYAFTIDEFREVISDVVNSNPELFYIRQDYGYGSFPLSTDSNIEIVSKCMGFYEGQTVIRETDSATGIGKIVGYTSVNKDEILEKRELLNEKKKSIISKVVPSGVPECAKALLLHDYIVLNIEYDNSDNIPDSDYDIYGALINKKAVCQGYSLAYKYLMEAAGFDSVGFASSSGHIWNTVTINDQGYYIDCTWDDPDMDNLGNVRHRYFLKGGKDFVNHTILKTDRVCNGTEFTAMFWNNVNSGIFYDNGYYYYIDSDGVLCKRNGLSEKAEISTAEISDKEKESWNYSNALKLALSKTYSKNIAENEIYTYKVSDESYDIPVQKVTIEGPNTLYIYMKNGSYVYEKGSLSAVITPSNATNKRIRKWTSSNTAVLKVDLNGTITAVATGEVTVTVYTYDGPSATYNIRVVLDGDIKADDGSTIHYDEGKLLCNQFYTENGNTYFLGADGKFITGMNKINGNIYYFNSSGIMLKGWQVINGNTHYFNSSGIMFTGWQVINGNTYYFNSTGVMLTGWQIIGETQYYFDAAGVLQTVGWKNIDGNTYYFNLNSVTVKGWQKIDGNTYYFDSNGVMQTGWKTIKKKKYYFNSNGVMQTGWKTIKKKKYYFNSNGVMQTGWKTIKKKKYYFNKKGVMQTGWKKIKGKKYYFTKKGVMVKGVKRIKGVSYYFAKDGHFVS